MPSTSRNSRSGHQEKGRIGKLSEKSASFHGHGMASQALLRRPKTDPDLLSGRNINAISPEKLPQLTKLLLNVTIQRSLGPVQVVMAPESTVGDLVGAAVRQYLKEGRRPLLPTTDPSGFDLHYSPFSLESLDREEKLIRLGSRNFFMCPSKIVSAASGSAVASTTSSSSCSNEVEKASKIALPWTRFMNFFM